MPILTELNHDDIHTSISTDFHDEPPIPGDELGCGCDRDAFACNEYGICGDDLQRDNGAHSRDQAFALCRSGDPGTC